ncbi:hypothetical protein HMPREF9080_00676 [Cardiobacterium valvarum F0432]|uniref:Uncharacterized protein n=1 Tax=Cardiobacterium valvarum F0432 TaxID=797473 RepID=G9ZD44_9GAMM|nr:hypothetical protein HMPREF9080_00676 [Cardiobacterium valvarum F0432]
MFSKKFMREQILPAVKGGELYWRHAANSIVTQYAYVLFPDVFLPYAQSACNHC